MVPSFFNLSLEAPNQHFKPPRYVISLYTSESGKLKSMTTFGQVDWVTVKSPVAFILFSLFVLCLSLILHFLSQTATNLTNLSLAYQLRLLIKMTQFCQKISIFLFFHSFDSFFCLSVSVWVSMSERERLSLVTLSL